MPMPLNQLLPQAGKATLIRELSLDSRTVRPGDLFLAIPGSLSDGRQHIADAIARGAVAVAYELDGAPVLPEADIEWVPVRGLAAQLSAIAGRFYGEPGRTLDLIGITGTNGKTSVSQLLAQALDHLDYPCGILGTLGHGFWGQLQAGRNTTPDALAVQSVLSGFKQAGARAVAMEVSSHGLEQGRVAAVEFDIAVFTNLSREHLDFHGSMQAYAQAKARLFAWPGLRSRVINLDDAFGRELAAEQQASRLVGYSLENPEATVHCSHILYSVEGIQARVRTPQGEGLLRSPLIGSFNLSNLLAVLSVLLEMNYPLQDALGVLAQVQGPAGRMQRLGGGHQPLVVVDYAHTPDALEKALQALRVHTRGRLLCLFGCGGDRDTGKRPLMASIAERLADVVMVTDDNPRSESSEMIIQDIFRGFERPHSVYMIEDRAEAIETLLGVASEGDVVLLAGKGHEDYQEVAGERLPFSDLVQAESALAAWGGRS